MKDKKQIVIIAVVAILAVAGIFAVMNNGVGPQQAETIAEHAAQSQERVAESMVPPPPEPEDMTEIAAPGTVAPSAGTPAAAPVRDSSSAPEAAINVEELMTLRTSGDPDAPVVMEEFASLSCPHCANFHTQHYQRLKEDYIDTGKVYYIFHDFPLNAAALDASMVARCMPPQQYSRFINFLFETQDDWAFQPNYRGAIRQGAKLLGASDDRLDACLASQDLRQALVTHMQDMARTYEITSTPTFVMNGQKAFTGAQPYESFRSAIDGLLAESEQE